MEYPKSKASHGLTEIRRQKTLEITGACIPTLAARNNCSLPEPEQLPEEDDSRYRVVSPLPSLEVSPQLTKYHSA